MLRCNCVVMQLCRVCQWMLVSGVGMTEMVTRRKGKTDVVSTLLISGTENVAQKAPGVGDGIITKESAGDA